MKNLLELQEIELEEEDNIIGQSCSSCNSNSCNGP